MSVFPERRLQEEAARHRKPGVADFIGVAQETGKVMPVGQIKFGFRAVDDGFVECDRETDGRVLDLIVIGVVGPERRK